MPDTYGPSEIGPVEHHAPAEYCVLCRYVVSDAPSERRQVQTYYYHQYCWAYALAQGEDVTSERLLRFAQSSTYLFCLPEMAGSDSTGVVTDVVHRSRISHEHSGNILKGIKERLPPDLQRLILNHAGKCPASSILHIENAGIVGLLQRVVLGPGWRIRCPIVRYMKFNFLFIEDCWVWCGCTTELGIFGYPGLKYISAEIPSDVTTVRFTVSRLGIQGLQFRGPRGVSILIGDFYESLWTGEMTSSDSLQYFVLILDGLKVRNLKIRKQQTPFGHRFMWKGDIPLSANIKVHCEKSCWPSAKYQVEGFRGWHLMAYLLLVRDKSVFYGITAYCAPGGAISGFESHFRYDGGTSSCSIGRKIGCAIYFALADSEYFDTAWALCDDIACFLGPFLVLRTNKGRIARFQPFMPPNLSARILRTGIISGIYYNSLRERSGILESFGLIYDSKATIIGQDQPIFPNNQDYETYLAAPPSGSFASKVLLADIFRIQACYRGERCMGMTLSLADDRIEVLGQWFECTGRRDLIFDMARDGAFRGLQFELCGPPYSTFVRKVTLLTMDMRTNCTGDFVQVAKYHVSIFTLVVQQFILTLSGYDRMDILSIV